MTPAYGRAPEGERVESSAPASWESVTVIAAMGLDGVRAPLAFEGAVDAPTFLAYVERVPVPALHRGDVVIFDNLASHLSPAVTAAIGRAGASVLPLPPYSPGFDPIEEMFSKLKEFLRRVGARAKDHLYDAIGDGLREVTPRDILGWFRTRRDVCHAGVTRCRAGLAWRPPDRPTGDQETDIELGQKRPEHRKPPPLKKTFRETVVMIH